MSVEFYIESPGEFDSRTLSRETLSRWTGRSCKRPRPAARTAAEEWLSRCSCTRIVVIVVIVINITINTITIIMMFINTTSSIIAIITVITYYLLLLIIIIIIVNTITTLRRGSCTRPWAARSTRRRGTKHSTAVSLPSRQTRLPKRRQEGHHYYSMARIRLLSDIKCLISTY